MLPGLSTIHPARSYKDLKFTYIGRLTSNTDTATYTFNNVNCGAQDNHKYVVIGAGSGTVGSSSSDYCNVTSIKIDGVSVTRFTTGTNVNRHPPSIGYGRVTKSGPITVEVVISKPARRLGGFIATVSSKQPLHFSGGAAQGTSSSSRSMTLSTPANGIALFYCCKGAVSNMTWSNAIAIDKMDVETSSYAFGVYYPTTTASRSHTCNFSSSDAGSGIAGLSFAPI